MVAPVKNDKSFLPWIALGIVIVAFAAIRIRLMTMPLERDEGEFAYMGQLMLHGIPPYKFAYNMKFPGIYAAYALVMAVFGRNIVGIHLGLILVNSISIALVYLIAKRVLDPIAGIVAAASFALLSIDSSVLGLAAHATQFVLPFALGGALLLLKMKDGKRPSTAFWSGILFGMAILMKQHAAPLALFGVLYIAWINLAGRPRSWKTLIIETGLASVGTLLPFGVSCIALYSAGVFSTFWFWTFQYAHQYVTEVPLSYGLAFLNESFRAVTTYTALLWAIAGVGVVVASLNGKIRGNLVFLGGFALFAFLCVCPGFFFRNHYYILLLPATALFIGVAEKWAREFISKRTSVHAIHAVPLILIAIAYFGSVSAQSDFLFRYTPAEACRARYGGNPFPESLEIADYIKAHSSSTDTVGVLGSEPQICFYSNRRSATGFIYTYGLMEKQAFASQMQRDMIKEIEHARPKFLVFVAVRPSWLWQPNSDKTIFKWGQQYVHQYYDVVGLFDIMEAGTTTYWGQDARTYMPTSADYVYVFERKPGV